MSLTPELQVDQETPIIPKNNEEITEDNRVMDESPDSPRSNIEDPEKEFKTL